MILLSRILFNVDKPWKRHLQRLLKAANIDPSCVDTQNEDFCIVVLPSESSQFKRFTSALTHDGIDWDTQIEARYDNAELDSAELLILALRKAHKGESGLGLGTEYDFDDACPRCGSGAQQRGPLIAKGLPPCKPASMIYTINGDVLVSPDLAKELKLDKRDVREVRHKTTGRTLDWVQLLPATEMPPMDASTTGVEIERQCDVCKRDGHYRDMDAPDCPTYKRSQIKGIPRIARTYELYGRSKAFDGKVSTRRIADPQLVIDQWVRRTLLDLKVRGLEFVPVRILA